MLVTSKGSAVGGYPDNNPLPSEPTEHDGTYHQQRLCVSLGDAVSSDKRKRRNRKAG